MHQSTEATGNVSLLDHFDKIMPAKKTHEVAFKRIIVFIFMIYTTINNYLYLLIIDMFIFIFTFIFICTFLHLVLLFPN